LVAINRLVRI